jgi:hypothetical protein
MCTTLEYIVLLITNSASIIPQTEQKIRERAYEIYLARGGQEGDEVSDWLAAERELNESNRPGKKARAAAVSL